MKKLIMPVRARHFKDAIFNSNCDCALARAAMEFFNVTDVGEGVSNLVIRTKDGETWYNHTYYGRNQFDADSEAAGILNYDETIIRKIELQQ